jgi:hypothetical protein
MSESENVVLPELSEHTQHHSEVQSCQDRVALDLDLWRWILHRHVELYEYADREFDPE